MEDSFRKKKSVGTDKNPPYLKNQILEYELIEQINGNFSTTPSNIDGFVISEMLYKQKSHLN